MGMGSREGMGELHAGLDQAQYGVSEVKAGSAERGGGDHTSAVERMRKGQEHILDGLDMMRGGMGMMGPHMRP